MEDHSHRVQQAISENITHLTSIVGDWGPWDDTYRFVNDRNQKFIDDFMISDSFVNFNINVMLFINSNGKVTYAKAMDLNKVKEIPIPAGLMEHMEKTSLTSKFSKSFFVKGIAVLPEGPMMLASNPIITSAHEGPVAGNLVVGRFLDDVEMRDISKRTHLAINLETLGKQRPAPYDQISDRSSVFVDESDSDKVTGYCIIKDIYSQPTLGVKFDTARRINAIGHEATSFIFLALIVLGLFSTLSTLLFLEKFILSRLFKLSERVKAIGDSGYFETVDEGVGRNDEIAVVTNEINTMLAKLNESQNMALESEKKFRTFVEKALDIVYSLDNDGRFTYVSPNCINVLGYTPKEMLGLSFESLIHDDDLEGWHKHMDSISLKQVPNGSYDYKGKNKGGAWSWYSTSVSIISNDNNEARFVGIFHSIDKYKQAEEALHKAHAELENRVQERTKELAKTNEALQQEVFEREKTQAKINYLAYYDYLTGLPNRSLIVDHLSRATSDAQKANKKMAVMFLDIDDFKMVNDTVGYAQGDLLLKEISIRLSNVLKNEHNIARIGGDEFVFIFPDLAELDQIEETANSILKIFDKPIRLNEIDYFVTACIGIALYPNDGNDADTLLKNADIAIYKAKERGRNEFMLCTPEIKSAIVEQMQLTNSLHQALKNNEFTLFYQPQVNSNTGEIVGLEALLRWQHPELGFISPAKFIPIAEQTGLIIPIGEWVLRTACAQNKAWQEAGLRQLRVAVNLSIRQFQSPKMAETIISILKETGLNANYLELEITENIAMNETEYVVKTLQYFKDYNITIAIDDFGTEYSSLQYLKQIPIDRVKITMPFVRGISVNKKDEAIIKTIIILARSLGLNVIAEGVETKEQLDFLSHQMCSEVQGYYFYKPMPAQDIEKLLMDGRTLGKAS